MRLFISVAILVFSALVVPVVIGFLVMEALTKVEEIKKRSSWFVRYADSRKTLVHLLLLAIVLLVGNSYELLVKEVPEIPKPPVLNIAAPLAPTIAPLPVKVFQEPPDSLRRRTFSLAKEVYDFAVDRAVHAPPFAAPDSNVPNPTEERKREIKISQDYARETETLYKERYRDRLVGIVKEYETKGVPVHWLANDFQQRPPSIAFLGSGYEGSPMDELYQFKELAYHVDARDHLITFY